MFFFPGGATYCAVASLSLLDRLHSTLSSVETERLKRWCLHKQEAGFLGRTNKTADASYSFWIGATLQVLQLCSQHSTDTQAALAADTEALYCPML